MQTKDLQTARLNGARLFALCYNSWNQSQRIITARIDWHSKLHGIYDIRHSGACLRESPAAQRHPMELPPGAMRQPRKVPERSLAQLCHLLAPSPAIQTSPLWQRNDLSCHSGACTFAALVLSTHRGLTMHTKIYLVDSDENHSVCMPRGSLASCSLL
jgi:hypothetical protein